MHEIRLSSAELKRLTELSIAGVRQLVGRLSRTAPTSDRLNTGSADRSVVLERFRRQQLAAEQLKRNRIGRLLQRFYSRSSDDSLIRRCGGILSFELGLDGYEAGWGVSVAKYFQSLVLRWDANRRAALLKAGRGRACVRTRTRSLASRSRLIAPVGAPPLFVH
ncbi:hypothetical protein AB1286_19605 [Trinickia sp. NRRL B-1857]|uniref:hypothetical protein n=1 Tax=Trinickia sp. NRRL B-1857 TaxID=3162879 RepID=UPI003D2C4596